jgi:WD40 repeat protein
LHDAASLRALRRIQVGRTVTVLAFSPDGRLLATGGSGPFVNVWEAATGRPVVDLPASVDCHFILALAFAPGGQQVYALESTGLLRHWDVQTKASFTVQTKLPWSEYYYDPAIHVTAKRVAVEMRQSHTIAIADLETGESIYSVKAAWPRSVIINTQGTHLAAIVDSTVKIWKLNTGEEVAAYAGHTGTINDIAFSPDGARLASSSADGTVQVWPVP